jgi:hypothetical protein
MHVQAFVTYGRTVGDQNIKMVYYNLLRSNLDGTGIL